MRNKEKQNYLFRRWLLIEMCFLAFMTVISMSIYIYADHHIKKQLDALHESNLKRAGGEAAAVLEAAQAVVDEYILNPSVRTLSIAGLKTSQRELAGLVDDIKQTNSASDAVAEVILYMKNEDMFISSAGIIDSVLYGELYDGGSLKDSISDQDTYGLFSPLYYGRGGFVTAVYKDQFMDRALVCAVIDSGKIEQLLAENLQDDKNTFFILTTKNKLLFALDGDLAAEAAGLVEDLDDASPRNITISGHDYVCFVHTTGELKTVSLIDRGSYLAGHLRIQRTAMILLAVSVILGLGISYYITRYQYGPVRDVFNAAKALTPEHVFTGSENELEQIKNAVEFINTQKEETEAVLHKHNVYIKDNALKLLLDGHINYMDMTEHVKSLLDLQPGAICTAAVMEPDHGSPADISAFTGVFLDLKHVLTKGGRIVLIFECSASDAAAQLVSADASGLLHGTIAVGNDGTGPDSLKDSYRQALIGLSRRLLPDAPKVIPPSGENALKIVTISAEDDIRLSGLIQSGDESASLSLLDRLTRIQGIGSLDLFSYKSYLFSIANVVIRCAEGVMTGEDVRSLLSDFNASFEREDHQSISKTLDNAVTSAAGSYRMKKNSGNKQLNTGIISYIELRISDPQLSSDLIAGAMSLNSAYLRRFFKEQNGISLWDFINTRRIEKAKNLLITTDASVKAIAEDCGYVSIATFTRAFRRFTGMTPGDYRNLYR